MKASLLVGLSGVSGLAGCQQTEMLELVRQQQAQISQLDTEVRSALVLHGVLGGVLLLLACALALMFYIHVREGGNPD